VCRELDPTETAVRRWVAQAETDRGTRDGIARSEREELARLRRAAGSAIFAYIEGSCNRRRLHSPLGYSSPAECEARHLAATGTA
jgi:transposase-like protein